MKIDIEKLNQIESDYIEQVRKIEEMKKASKTPIEMIRQHLKELGNEPAYVHQTGLYGISYTVKYEKKGFSDETSYDLNLLIKLLELFPPIDKMYIAKGSCTSIKPRLDEKDTDKKITEIEPLILKIDPQPYMDKILTIEWVTGSLIEGRLVEIEIHMDTERDLFQLDYFNESSGARMNKYDKGKNLGVTVHSLIGGNAISWAKAREYRHSYTFFFEIFSDDERVNFIELFKNRLIENSKTGGKNASV